MVRIVEVVNMMTAICKARQDDDSQIIIVDSLR